MQNLKRFVDIWIALLFIFMLVLTIITMPTYIIFQNLYIIKSIPTYN